MISVEYMNDRRTAAMVYCGEDLSGKPIYLPPATSGLFYLDIPAGERLFIKVWETNVVLITHRIPTIDMTPEVSE